MKHSLRKVGIPVSFVYTRQYILARLTGMLKGGTAGSAFGAGCLVISIACALTVIYSSHTGALETTRRIARLEALHATEVRSLALVVALLVRCAGSWGLQQQPLQRARPRSK